MNENENENESESESEKFVEQMRLNREYMDIPDCGLDNALLERLVDSALAERARREAVIRQDRDIGWCACMGPVPYCKCIRRALKHEIAAAVCELARSREIAAASAES